ncbi:MAG: tetraacyldisaccharide 4'-kinase [Pseudomonadota bacterium]
MKALYNWLHRVWYEDGALGWLLVPFSWLYSGITSLRTMLYRRGMLNSAKAAVPVIVVGNITAGGTGKTPTVVWLAEQLKARGWSPGIVSRGYGGSRSGTSMRVDVDSDAAVVGDEPVLLARRTQCPVAVDADRLRATEMLVEDGANVVIADDGLQHLRLQRDVELCVVDGRRGLGNGRLLPAGPLREPARRLESVDAVLINGGDFQREFAFRFSLSANDVRRLNGSVERPLAAFSGSTVHAVAGIGNPSRFFDQLRAAGVQVIEHPLRDHETLSRGAIEFGDGFDVFMTEKDAVKLGTSLPDRFWYLPVDFALEPEGEQTLMNRIVERLSDCKET